MGSVAVTITARDDATFVYANAIFCANGTNPAPSVNTTGGTFTATPVGLSINPASGLVDLANSTVATYTIQHVTNGACPDTSTQPFTIIPADTASFDFTDTTVCLNGAGNPTIPVNTGIAGTFSASPAGLDIDPTTGVINAATSSLGTYTVTFTTSGNCPVSASTRVVASVCGQVTKTPLAPQYTLYPNPNNGQFTIEYNGSVDQVQVAILDALGQRVHLQMVELNGGQAIIEWSNPIPGTYWVRLQDEAQTQVQKMIIAR